MQKNWYIVYTKPRCEKKVANVLTKRKIENFFPLNCKQINSYRRIKLHYEPLFTSYVFVYINKDEVPYLKNIEGIVNLVYWKGEPAVIKNEEINAIKEFTSTYTNIRLERTEVNLYDDLQSSDEPAYIIDRNLVMVKNRSFKISLPSMGYTLLADIKVESGRGLDVSFDNRRLRLQS